MSRIPPNRDTWSIGKAGGASVRQEGDYRFGLINLNFENPNFEN
jgi:hypothetical protein